MSGYLQKKCDNEGTQNLNSYLWDAFLVLKKISHVMCLK
jgi:hypothetical protein